MHFVQMPLHTSERQEWLRNIGSYLRCQYGGGDVVVRRDGDGVLKDDNYVCGGSLWPQQLCYWSKWQYVTINLYVMVSPLQAL